MIKKIINWALAKRQHGWVKILTNIANGNKLSLCDIGGAGGLQPRWRPYEHLLHTIFFEPDARSASALIKAGSRVVEHAAWSEKTRVKLYSTKYPKCSSVFKPNQDYLNKFPDPDLTDVVSEPIVSTTTIDEEFETLDAPDFIKLDIQGAEYAALKGASRTLEYVLGLEIEVEFKPLYLNQPLFADIQKLLESKHFLFVDLTSIGRWERERHRKFGEFVDGDALFLKSPEDVLARASAGVLNDQGLRKYLLILTIYNRLDLIKILAQGLSWEQQQLFSTDKIIRRLENAFNSIYAANRVFALFLRWWLPHSSSHILY